MGLCACFHMDILEGDTDDKYLTVILCQQLCKWPFSVLFGKHLNISHFFWHWYCSDNKKYFIIKISGHNMKWNSNNDLNTVFFALFSLMSYKTDDLDSKTPSSMLICSSPQSAVYLIFTSDLKRCSCDFYRKVNMVLMPSWDWRVKLPSEM